MAAKEAKRKKPTRSELRAASMGKKHQFKRKLVEIDGNQFEVRQLSLKERSELRKKCSFSQEENETGFDLFEFATRCVIASTYVPDTDELLFGDEDFDELMETPPGGFVDQLSEHAMELMYVGMDSKKKSSKRILRNS